MKLSRYVYLFVCVLRKRSLGIRFTKIFLDNKNNKNKKKKIMKRKKFVFRTDSLSKKKKIKNTHSYIRKKKFSIYRIRNFLLVDFFSHFFSALKTRRMIWHDRVVPLWFFFIFFYWRDEKTSSFYFSFDILFVCQKTIPPSSWWLKIITKNK